MKARRASAVYPNRTWARRGRSPGGTPALFASGRVGCWCRTDASMRPPVSASHGPHARRLAALASITTVLAIGVSAVQQARPPITPPIITVPDGSAAVEQTSDGTRPAAEIVESFDGLGVGFDGPQGMAPVRNPSDNTLAVGPDHIVQIVNTRLAIFTKKGRRFDRTGRALYGAVPTNVVFRGFGGTCEATSNGDAVVRYDQLAKRWLIVMPIFRRAAARPDQPPGWTARESPYLSPPGRPGQPGPAVRLPDPPPVPEPRQAPAPAPAAPRRGHAPDRPLRDVLRGEHGARPDGPVLSLRVPAAALPRLSETGHLARRLLRADEHRRRPDLRDDRDPEARVRRRPGEDAPRSARHRAVHRHRQRGVPEQRGPGRDRAPAARARRTS